MVHGWVGHTQIRSERHFSHEIIISTCESRQIKVPRIPGASPKTCSHPTHPAVWADPATNPIVIWDARVLHLETVMASVRGPKVPQGGEPGTSALPGSLGKSRD